MSISIVINAQPDTSLNYSNRNAALVLGTLGIDTSEGYGEISFAELPRLRQRAIRALHQAWGIPTVRRVTSAVRRVSSRSTASRRSIAAFASSIRASIRRASSGASRRSSVCWRPPTNSGLA